MIESNELRNIPETPYWYKVEINKSLTQSGTVYIMHIYKWKGGTMAGHYVEPTSIIEADSLLGVQKAISDIGENPIEAEFPEPERIEAEAFLSIPEVDRPSLDEYLTLQKIEDMSNGHIKCIGREEE